MINSYPMLIQAKKFIKYVIFLILTIYISGCSSEFAILFENPSMNELEIEVFKPAKVTIPYEIYQLLVVAAAKDDKEFFTKVRHFKKRSIDSEYRLETVYRFNNSPLDSMTSAFQSILEEQDRYLLVNTEPIRYQLKENKKNWEQLKALCEKHNTDAIVYLNDFNYDYTIYENSDAFNYKTIDYILKLSLNWRLMNPYEKEILDTKTTKASDSWTETGNINLNVKSFIRESNDYLASFAKNMAYEYGRRISPVWQPETRYYYTSGPPEFNMANEYAENNEWEKAREIWRKYYQSDNFVTAKHAAYNLALANEILGNLDKAYELAKISEQKYKDARAKYYAELLEKRIEEQKLLMKQMGNQ